MPLAVDRQEADGNSMLHLTRRLVAFRKRHVAVRLGGIEAIDVPEPLLAFERAHPDERLLCVFNLGPQSVPWALPDGWRIIESVGDVTAHGLPPNAGYIAQRAA